MLYDAFFLSFDTFDDDFFFVKYSLTLYLTVIKIHLYSTLLQSFVFLFQWNSFWHAMLKIKVKTLILIRENEISHSLVRVILHHLNLTFLHCCVNWYVSSFFVCCCCCSFLQTCSEIRIFVEEASVFEVCGVHHGEVVVVYEANNVFNWT